LKQINPPQIGLSLGGGVVRAVAHLGVLDIFHRAGIPIGVIAGTSGGSLVGAFYASQKFQISTLIDMVSNLGWWNWVRPGWSREGLMDSDKIGQFVVDRLGPLAFQDLSIPFAAVACNLANGFKVVLTQGPLAPAV
jgi:NTE family protein